MSRGQIASVNPALNHKARLLLSGFQHHDLRIIRIGSASRAHCEEHIFSVGQELRPCVPNTFLSIGGQEKLRNATAGRHTPKTLLPVETEDDVFVRTPARS